MNRATINADTGEAFDLHTFGNDERLLPLVDTVDVACGFHAGDPSTMRATVEAAAAAGVSIGAHPGLPDLVGFGRRAAPHQAPRLDGRDGCSRRGAHGRGARRRGRGGRRGFRDARHRPREGCAGARVDFTAELYVDLAYRGDGSLSIVARPGATDPQPAAERARGALLDGATRAIGGEELAVRVESICVHSAPPTSRRSPQRCVRCSTR